MHYTALPEGYQTVPLGINCGELLLVVAAPVKIDEILLIQNNLLHVRQRCRGFFVAAVFSRSGGRRANRCFCVCRQIRRTSLSALHSLLYTVLPCSHLPSPRHPAP